MTNAHARQGAHPTRRPVRTLILAVLLLALSSPSASAGSRPADLSLTMSGSPPVIEQGEGITYTVRVRNAGPNAVDDPRVLVYFSSGRSGFPDQGFSDATGADCEPDEEGDAECELGALRVGQTRTFTVGAGTSTRIVGPVVGEASVLHNGADPIEANNDAEVRTVVRPRGGACTTTGTSGNDVIRGTRGRDVICAGAGHDRIYALTGNDVIRAGPGHDLVEGGLGNDLVFGAEGKDRLRGGPGANDLDGGPGDDALSAGDGPDDLEAGPGRDRVNPGGGDDSADGGLGNDVVRAGAGDDFVGNSPGSDSLEGGPGDDGFETTDDETVDEFVEDENERDVINAGPGNDDLIYSGGKIIEGGPGNDFLDGGDGAIVMGGEGRDHLQTNANGDKEIADGGPDRDECFADDFDLVRGCETGFGFGF